MRERKGVGEQEGGAMQAAHSTPKLTPFTNENGTILEAMNDDSSVLLLQIVTCDADVVL